MSGAANPTHEVHRGDIPYQAPFARSASPNDSLTTAYGADETNLSDKDLSEDSFSDKVLAGLHIYEKREEEERAEVRPLIMPRMRRATVNGQMEEKAMFDQVMRSLRWHVEAVEEEDTIESMLQRRIKAVMETQTSASETVIIMESMMDGTAK